VTGVSDVRGEIVERTAPSGGRVPEETDAH
jgi:hypothetical protein